MTLRKGVSRRSTLKSIGAGGALSLIGSSCAQGNEPAYYTDAIHRDIFEKVWRTPFIDTHEHLIEESSRLSGTAHPRIPADDWSLLFNHYTNSDLLTAGMPKADAEQFFSSKIDPLDKWRLIELWWPAVQHTGYAQAVRIAVRELYGIEQITGDTIRQIQDGYERTRTKGFYTRILRDVSNIESCQVNSFEGPFKESELPTLLMQDLSIVGMLSGPNIQDYAGPAGIDVRNLNDWHRVIDWWFEKYGTYAVAVKSQHAYNRDINYQPVAADHAGTIFERVLKQQNINSDDRTVLQDHLFWKAVETATACHLPVKLHTGYYAGDNRMPLSRLINNPGSACDLCRTAPGTRFIFMHISYPYYEELLSVAKHYTNACIDMCWAWIINPIAAKDFLKKYIVTAPSNKILTFGGDYMPVELVPGHAIIARRGIALALTELVDEGWLSTQAALDLVDPLMHGNARRIFNLEEKEQTLKNVPWL